MTLNKTNIKEKIHNIKVNTTGKKKHTITVHV
jgi:hypothetical protein